MDLDKKTENIHSETTLLLQERDVLKEKLKEERARNSMLEKQLADKLNMCSAVQKREVPYLRYFYSYQQHHGEFFTKKMEGGGK